MSPENILGCNYRQNLLAMCKKFNGSLLNNILTNKSTSLQDSVFVSFRFRVENKLPFSALVSFSAENAKPGFGRSLATTIGLLGLPCPCQ